MTGACVTVSAIPCTLLSRPVITGLDNNVQGIADTVTQAPVITASGMTAEEICSEVESRIQ